MPVNAPLVSILIPHFQTYDLVRLCLRSIRRYTKGVSYEVVVIDNGSQDGTSLEYLRRVEWIRLIERTERIGPGPQGHLEAVQIGIDQSSAPLILSFHTDTIPIRDDWLVWHIEQIRAHDRIGAVGTYKLELKSRPLRILKALEYRVGLWKTSNSQIGDHRPYIRSHCALYRRDVLEELRLRYDDFEDTAGRPLHYAIESNGYEARLLNVKEAMQRIVHLNHGTMALISELDVKKRTVRNQSERLKRFLFRTEFQKILADESLDIGDSFELLDAT